MFKELFTGFRLTITTLVVCSLLYPLFLWLFAQITVPQKAEGSLVRTRNGVMVGSELIAQKFIKPEYFWPRPSAVDYNAAATGGSNLSPTNPKLAERANSTLAAYRTPVNKPVPVDLITASGSGVDPHITITAAHFQVARIAAARKQEEQTIHQLIESLAFDPAGDLLGERLVNVLLLNLALDER